jgi:hypothetical protein
MRFRAPLQRAGLNFTPLGRGEVLRCTVNIRRELLGETDWSTLSDTLRPGASSSAGTGAGCTSVQKSFVCDAGESPLNGDIALDIGVPGDWVACRRHLWCRAGLDIREALGATDMP